MVATSNYLPSDHVIHIMRYVLVGFNAGMALLAVLFAVYALHAAPSENKYNFIHETSGLSHTGLIVIASLLLVVAAALAIYYGHKQITYLIYGYILLMIGILIMDAVIGVGLIRGFDDTETQLKTSMEHTMSTYYFDPNSQNKWDAIQRELKCCGTLSPVEWVAFSPRGQVIPRSCCRFVNVTGPTCEYRSDPNIVYQNGCYDQLMNQFDKPIHDRLLGSEIVLQTFQLINIIFAVILAYAAWKKQQHGGYGSGSSA